MNPKKIMAVIGVLVLMVSCKNDPYPEGVKFESLEQSKQRTQRVRQKKTMFILAQPFMQFVEGEEGRYKIDGIVASGNPVIDFVGLPDGADFDLETRELVWTPDFSAADDERDVNIVHREYNVQIQMNDQMNELIFVEKKIVLIVFDSTREALIWTDRRGDLVENEVYTQEIEILSEDFSDMDFEVFSPDIPKGASLEKKEDGKYELRFQPALDFAKVSDSKDSEGYYRDIHFPIHAVGPRGKRATKMIHWRVRDKNKGIQVNAPTRLQGTDRLAFMVALRDLNGEHDPSLRFKNSSYPGYGNISVEKLSSSSQDLFFSQYQVLWENIPKSKIGAQEVLSFEACGHVDRAESCQEFSVTAEFKKKEEIVATPPKFDRNAWPLGTIKRTTVGRAPLFVYFPIRPWRSRNRVEVEVSDPSLRVKWKHSRLLVSGKVAGIYQFNAKAISPEGLETTESMIVEIVAPEGGEN